MHELALALPCASIIVDETSAKAQAVRPSAELALARPLRVHRGSCKGCGGSSIPNINTGGKIVDPAGGRGERACELHRIRGICQPLGGSAFVSMTVKGPHAKPAPDLPFTESCYPLLVWFFGARNLPHLCTLTSCESTGLEGQRLQGGFPNSTKEEPQQAPCLEQAQPLRPH